MKRTIREFLEEHFNDSELIQFCFEHFSDVQKEFSDEMRRSKKIQLLLEYCRKHSKFNFLCEQLRIARDTLQDEIDCHNIEPLEKLGDRLNYVFKLLEGKNVINLNEPQFKEIEEYLMLITQDFPGSATAWAILGFVKHDYKIPRSASTGDPNIKEIREKIENLGKAEIDCRTINVLKPTQRALKFFDLKC